MTPDDYMRALKVGREELEHQYNKLHDYLPLVPLTATYELPPEEGRHQTCEYCGKHFYKLREECDNCGATLPLPQAQDSKKALPIYEGLGPLSPSYNTGSHHAHRKTILHQVQV